MVCLTIQLLEKMLFKHCLEALRPHLKMKKRQATLLLQIIKQSQKKEEPNAFLTRCKLVDQVSRLNDSKVSEQRKVTSETVRSLFLKLGDLSPDQVTK